MTILGYKNPNQNIFTYGIGYINLAIIVIYVITNIIFIKSCYSKYLENNVSSFCSEVSIFSFLRHIVPIVFRPAEVLIDRGDMIRADFAIAIYSFAWGSFIVFSAIMVAIAVLRVKLLSSEKIDSFIEWESSIQSDLAYNKFLRDQVYFGGRIMNLISLIAFFAAFWGYFSFDELDYNLDTVDEVEINPYFPIPFLALVMFYLSIIIVNKVRIYIWRRFM